MDGDSRLARDPADTADSPATDPAAVSVSGPSPDPPRTGRTLRPLTLRHFTVAATAALAATVLVLVVLGNGSGGRGHPVVPRTGPAPSPRSTVDRDALREAAVRALLQQRARAILHGDRAALVATIDPTQHAFRAEQLRTLANLRDVPLAGWSYVLDPSNLQPHTRALARYHVPTWAPGLQLRYKLRGFDVHATELTQYPTFTERGGRWYLASLSDFVSRGDVSATELWNYSPVRVVRGHGVLVLGAPEELGLMQQLVTEVEVAIPAVDAVWGRDWSQKVVVLVPQTQAELGLITGDTADLGQIAALSSAEVQKTPGRPAPVGSRVSINPANWPKLAAAGRQVVITHELTHIATRADTSVTTPTWLVEGFANYVGYGAARIGPLVGATELAASIQAGQAPRSLPRDRDFDGGSAGLAQAYEQAWLACRYIAEGWGQRTLVAFYREVGTSPAGAHRSVTTAMHRLLHLSPAQFLKGWRAYLVDVLG